MVREQASIAAAADERSVAAAARFSAASGLGGDAGFFAHDMASHVYMAPLGGVPIAGAGLAAPASRLAAPPESKTSAVEQAVAAVVAQQQASL